MHDFCTSYDNIFKRLQDATEELLVLTDTIKILNDNAALKFFKMLPVPVHVRCQTRVANADIRCQAVVALATDSDYHFDSISSNADKDIKMVDDIVVLLGSEQMDLEESLADDFESPQQIRAEDTVAVRKEVESCFFG